MREIDPDSIEARVREALNCVAERRASFRSAGDWTTAIKQELVRTKFCGCEAYASSGGEGCGREWLYDLCWLKIDRKKVDKNVIRAPLIVECEWDRNGLMDDFPKLIIGRADLRVFIFQAEDETEYEQHRDTFITAVTDSKLTAEGDRYLLACWNIDQKKFEFCPHTA